MEMESKGGESSIQGRDIYFPQELWVQHILPRVAVKTLLRFRCVCKYWCFIIDDPHFINIHLKLYKNNCEKNRILAMERLGYNGFRGSRFVVREILTLRKTTHLFKTSELYRLLGGCNGLLLLRFGKQLKLWNPSVRKYVSLPDPYPFRSNKVILGYAPLTDDYKVVILKITYSNITEVSFAIYSLKDHSWRCKVCRVTDIPGHGFLEGVPFIYFQGAAYWIDPYRSFYFGSLKTKLAFFDFDTEELSYVPLPPAASWLEEACPWETIRCLFLLGESLAIFSVSSTSRSVWVMEKDGEKRSWSLWFSGDSSGDYHRSFKDQGEFQDFSHSKIFFVENSSTCFLYGKKSCTTTSHHMESLSKAMSRHITLEPYIESLVLSRGCTNRNMTPFPGICTRQVDTG